MDTINTWKINYFFEKDTIIDIIDKNINMSTKLLDLSKSEYSLFEKVVYDSAFFHFKRLNIDIKNNDYFIEFWCKNKFDTHKLHVDCDEYLKKTQLEYVYPILSCITYFNDNLNPTIITNVDLEKYKYKDFETQKELFLSMPTCNKQITFDGHFYHGSTILSENHKQEKRYIIAINLWNTKPTNIDYYIPDTDNKQLFLKEENLVTIDTYENNIQTINVCKKIINYNFFDDILYSNDSEKTCYCFDELIKNTITEKTVTYINSYKFVLDLTIEKKALELNLKNKYGNIMDDINQIMYEDIQLKYNRFLQRFHYTTVYTPDICRFIINECEKYSLNNGGWTTKRHNNYPTTDLPVEKIPSIFGLILETMKTISKKVHKSYGLHENMIVNINDLFVVKYKEDAQNYLEMHKDGSFLSFNILLSDKNDFEGGGTYFDDGLTSHLEQGDILIHSSRIKHSGLPIVKGIRYLLVGFLNINIHIDT